MEIQQKIWLKMVKAFIHVSNKHVIVVYMERKALKYLYSCQINLEIYIIRLSKNRDTLCNYSGRSLGWNMIEYFRLKFIIDIYNSIKILLKYWGSVQPVISL